MKQEVFIGFSIRVFLGQIESVRTERFDGKAVLGKQVGKAFVPPTVARGNRLGDLLA
jgi:hypothetical protein